MDEELEECVEINEVICEALGIDLSDVFIKSIQINLHAQEVPTVTIVKYIELEDEGRILAQCKGKLQLVED